jgi:hypothetical protein
MTTWGVLREERVRLPFYRSFELWEIEDRQELSLILTILKLFGMRAKIGYSAVTNNICSSTRAIYNVMVHPRVEDVRIMDLWHTHMPLRIRLFFWMRFWVLIQVTSCLSVQGWL